MTTTDISLDEICDAIARRIAKRKAAEIHKKVAELLEQEFAELGDTADEPERDEAGEKSSCQAAPAETHETTGAIDVPAFLRIPEPAKSVDPGHSAAGGMLIPSMVAKQSGELEAGETTAASAQGASSPALCAPAEPAAVEGDCGHEPPEFIIEIPDAAVKGYPMQPPSDGGVKSAEDVSPKAPDGMARTEASAVTARRDEQPLEQDGDRGGGGRAQPMVRAGERVEQLRSSASVLPHHLGQAPPGAKRFELPDIPKFLRRSA